MRPWRRRFYRQLAIARREVAQLVALVERRAAAASKPPAGGKFRPLSQTETTTLLGDELLAQVAAGAGRA